MKREGAAAAGIVALFFAVRIPLLVVRQPFFDELFTRWISAKPFGAIVDALRYDSGPPLYYFLVHLFGHGRGISLVASFAALIILLLRKELFAAAFIAVFPPSVLFAVDARSYALCALFLTIGLLFEKVDAIAFVAAAYSHFYGVLFFPLLIRKPKKLILAAALFEPGFYLAWQQPAAAREWMTHAWPAALFVPPPLPLAIIGAIALLWALIAPHPAFGHLLPASGEKANIGPRPSSGEKENIGPRPAERGEGGPERSEGPGEGHLAAVLVPLALALILRVYVPLRFESVIAVPLALCIGESLRRSRGIAHEILASVLLGVAAIWSIVGIVDHANRPPDEYRRAAVWLASNVSSQDRVVASGYLYLETIMNGRPDALAYPAEQAIHPGWRAFAQSTEAVRQAPFVWIGERQAPELAFIGSKHRVEPLCINARAMVARIR